MNMTRWYEDVTNDTSNIVYSRVRLSRNWEEYKFPCTLTDDEAREMILRLRQGFSDIDGQDGCIYRYADLESMEKLDRVALRERRLLNRTLSEKTTPGGFICSEDEHISIVLNADDHIRLQVLSQGLSLKECYSAADTLDDYMSEKISYAFNDKYGYLTSYPTNVGTAMKASVVVHLPSLTMNKKFQEFLSDMGRFGTSVRGVYGRGNENYGDLYEVVSQKTLGITEQEILELVSNVAGQLSAQEKQFREASLSKHHLVREDEAYKSYGILKYARKLTIKEAMTYLSHVWAGIADGLLKPRDFVSIYNLMLDIQPANLQKRLSRPLGRSELEVERARYIKEKLPELAN